MQIGGWSWEGQYFKKNDQTVRVIVSSSSKIQTSAHPRRQNIS